MRDVKREKPSLGTDPGRGIIGMLKHLVDNVNDRHEYIGDFCREMETLKRNKWKC